MWKLNLKKLIDVEGKEEYWIEMSNSFADLEYLDDDVDNNRAWETIEGTIKISANESLGYYEFKQHKS
jgi:hypothetical protein